MKIYFLIPNVNDTGPVRGMIALAKGLKALGVGVEIISLYLRRNNKVVDIETRSLKSSNLLLKYFELKKIQKAEPSAVFISMNFKTDLLVALMKNANCIQYLRGDLYKNYYYTYGRKGYFLAYVNYFISNFFSVSLALNKNIASQVRNFSKNVQVLGNSIDEHHLSNYQKSPINRHGDKPISFVFLGSLTNRKRPELLVSAAEILRKDGVKFNLTFIGDGPLRSKLERQIVELELENYVRLVGHLSDPFELLCNFDVFVLPSMSEGISRAMLETQFLGLSTIIRDTDENEKYLTCKNQGQTFNLDEELPKIMKAMYIKKVRRSTESLMSDKFSLELNARNLYEVCKKLTTPK